MAEKKTTTKKKQPQKKDALKPIEGKTKYLPAAASVDKDSNDYIIETNMKILALPPFDLHTATDEETAERVSAFFDIYRDTNLKPPLAGLALAVGLDRRRLWEIANGDLSCATYLSKGQADLLKKAHKSMEVLWESYLENGKINPVAAIFLGKNHYGYKDTTDVVVTPNGQKEDYSAEDIAAKYALPAEEQAKVLESPAEE